MLILRDLLRKWRICCHEEEKGKLNRQRQSKMCKKYICKKIKDFLLQSSGLFTSNVSLCLVELRLISVAWQTKSQPHGPGGLTGSGAVPILTNGYTANLQGHACYPTINKDEQKTERKRSSAQPISSHTGINNDNTTRLSPLIKGYKQQRKQHPRQAVALVERCTSVTQSKRRAGIISVATPVRGTTPSPKLLPAAGSTDEFQQMHKLFYMLLLMMRPQEMSDLRTALTISNIDRDVGKTPEDHFNDALLCSGQPL